MAWMTTACSTADSSPEETALSPALISILSGNGQTGQGGRELDDPVIIRVTDETQLPLPDIQVSYSVVEGYGHVIGAPIVFTDQQGLLEVHWMVGAGYNGIEVRLTTQTYEAKPAYLYAIAENPSGLFMTRSIASLEQLDEKLYTMTFFGDFSEILEQINNRIIDSKSTISGRDQNRQCSIFASIGTSQPYFFGRSYDNPTGWDCLILVCRCHPSDGYASLTLSRMKDYGFEPGTDFDHTSFQTKKNLFEALYYTPDGINEHGVSAACAGVPLLKFDPVESNKWIWITGFVREVLDHARNIEEAIDIASRHNIFDHSLNTLETHFLIADASGRSVILEVFDRALRIIPNDRPWQVATNSPVYDLPVEEQIENCYRFRLIFNQLLSLGGDIQWEQGMDILETVKFDPPGTQWSSLYNLTNRTMHIALNCNFEKFYHFSFTSN